jgi:hypothetical protein
MLVALAIRIGVALGLGSEDPRSISAFDLECRRRLWYCIAIIDTQAALDRGTVPMLSSAYLGPPPLNIADCDMSPQSMPETDSQGFTNMSFTMMMSEATICQKQLSEPSSAGTNGWQHKIQLADAFAESMQGKYIQRREEHTPFATFLRLAAEETLLGIQLLLRRPPYALKIAVPPSDPVDITEISTKILEVHAQFQSAELSPWIWMRWVPWYSLGVVLAELCVRPNVDSAERSWAAAKQTFNRYARLLSNPDSGMPWRPILKLMSRVQRQRQNDARVSSTASPQTATSSSSAPSRGTEASSGEPILENMFFLENQNETAAYDAAIGNADMDWDFNFDTFSLPLDYNNLDITYSGLEPPNIAFSHGWDPWALDISSLNKEK